MSKSADLLEAGADRDIQAALVWDLPQLIRGSPGARAFADAFAASPLDDLADDQDDPLAWAAAAVVLERRGEQDEAVREYWRIAEREGWCRLLGLCLLSWSPGSEGTDVIRSAQLAVATLPQGALKARLLTKLTTFALDKNDRGLMEALLNEALDNAPPGSELARALMVESLNLGHPRGSVQWGEEEEPADADELVTYPWITEIAWKAARSALHDEVEARSRDHWSYTFRAGRTPLDEVITAEIQATWAGALWIRRAIRQQLGAQLLRGTAVGPRQWAYGVLMWLFGGGSRPSDVFETAEPHLDSDSANLIVRELSQAVDSPNREDQFLEVSLAAWDLLSDDMVLSLLNDRLSVGSSDHPRHSTGRRLWAALATREPEIASERFIKMEENAQVALLDSLTPFTLKRFTADAAGAALNAARAAVREDHPNDRVFLALAELSRRAEAVDQASALFRVPPLSMVANLVESYPEFVTPAAREDAIVRLAGIVRRQAEDALEGRQGIGSFAPAIQLGRLLDLTQADLPDAVQTLVRSATHESLPSSLVFEARQGLAQAYRERAMPPDIASELREATDVAEASPFLGGVSHDVLKLARLRPIAPDLSREELGEAVALCRDQDPRVREVALATVGSTLEATPGDAVLESALTSALFDPSGQILQLGLWYVRRLRFKSLGARRIVESRLPRLFGTGGRDVRLGSILTARHLLRDEPADRVLRTIILRGRDDRSWMVRFEAAQSQP
jgi:hypothetical protein